MFLTIQKKTLLSFSTLLLLSLMMVFIAQLYIVKILCMIAIGVLMSKKIRVSKFVLLNFIFILVYWSFRNRFGDNLSKPQPISVPRCFFLLAYFLAVFYFLFLNFSYLIGTIFKSIIHFSYSNSFI